eukprot:143857-Amphidinium_carterae.1
MFGCHQHAAPRSRGTDCVEVILGSTSGDAFGKRRYLARNGNNARMDWGGHDPASPFMEMAINYHNTAWAVMIFVITTVLSHKEEFKDFPNWLQQTNLG